MRREHVECAVMGVGLALVWLGGMTTGFFLSLLLRGVKNPWRSVP